MDPQSTCHRGSRVMWCLAVTSLSFGYRQVVSGVTGDSGNNSQLDDLDLSAAHGLAGDEILLATDCTSGADLFQHTGGGSESLSRSAVLAPAPAREMRVV